MKNIIIFIAAVTFFASCTKKDQDCRGCGPSGSGRNDNETEVVVTTTTTENDTVWGAVTLMKAYIARRGTEITNSNSEYEYFYTACVEFKCEFTLTSQPDVIFTQYRYSTYTVFNRKNSISTSPNAMIAGNQFTVECELYPTSVAVIVGYDDYGDEQVLVGYEIVGSCSRVNSGPLGAGEILGTPCDYPRHPYWD